MTVAAGYSDDNTAATSRRPLLVASTSIRLPIESRTPQTTAVTIGVADAPALLASGSAETTTSISSVEATLDETSGQKTDTVPACRRKTMNRPKHNPAVTASPTPFGLPCNS